MLEDAGKTEDEIEELEDPETSFQSDSQFLTD